MTPVEHAAVDLEAAGGIVAVDSVDYTARPGEPQGIEDVRNTMRFLDGAFSDQHFEVVQTVEEDDRVVVHFTHSGRNTGEIMELEPSNGPFSYEHIHILRFEDGKMVEDWGIHSTTRHPRTRPCRHYRRQIMEHLWSRADANARERSKERSVESCVTTCKRPLLVASARRGAEMVRGVDGSSRQKACKSPPARISLRATCAGMTLPSRAPFRTERAAYDRRLTWIM